MTRIRRTTALITAAVLALGVTACSAKHQNDSVVSPADVSTVAPDAGYEGAGVPATSAAATGSTEAGAGTVDEDTTAGPQAEPTAAGTAGTAGTAGAAGAVN